MKLYSVFTSLFVLCLINCTGNTTYDRLATIEEYLQDAPDSALYALKDIRREDLHSKRDYAYWALLTSAALDKVYIDIASDSLIVKAVNYYSQGKDIHHRMMAYYYNGIVNKNAKNYKLAIASLEKASTDALALNDPFYSGLVFRNISEVFTYTNNVPAAIAYIQKAIASFEQSGYERYTYYAKLSLAGYYVADRNFYDARNCIEELKSIPEIKDNCRKLDAAISVHLGEDPLYSVALYKGVTSKVMTYEDYALFALALEKSRNTEEADLRLSEAYNLCSSINARASVDYVHAKIKQLRGHFEEAYYLTRKASAVQDSVTRVILKQSIIEAQKEYYKTESLLQEEKMLRERDRLIFWCVSCAFILCLTCIHLMIKRKESIRKQEELILSLKYRQQLLDQAQRNNAELIGSLFRERINHLDAISDSFLDAEDEKDRYLALKQFKTELASMRKDQNMFQSLENDLNTYCNGVMKKLAQQVPSIKGENKKTILLFFAGVPDKTIQLLMNKVSIESLRMARSRLRKEIIASQAPDQELFLKMLTKKKRPTEET